MDKESIITAYKGEQSLEGIDDNALLFAVTPDCEIMVGTKKDFASIDFKKDENLNYCTEEFYNTLATVILKTMFYEKEDEVSMDLTVDDELILTLTAKLKKFNAMTQKDDGTYIQ